LAILFIIVILFIFIFLMKISEHFGNIIHQKATACCSSIVWIRRLESWHKIGVQYKIRIRRNKTIVKYLFLNIFFILLSCLVVKWSHLHHLRTGLIAGGNGKGGDMGRC
jgi:hypothetical protein